MKAEGGSRRWRMAGLGICGCALGSALTLGAPQKNPSPPLPRISPKAQELLTRTIQALGGRAFLGFKTMTSKGSVYSFSQGQVASVEPFVSTFAPPDKRHFRYGKSKPVLLINNGDQAWEIDQYGRVHQPPDEVRAWKLATRYNLENLLRLRVRETGVLILDDGSDFVGNQPVYVLEIIDNRGIHVKLYVHHSTYLPVRVTYRIQNPQTLDWEEYADNYGDYQPFQGIETPMQVSRTRDDERTAAVYRESVRYDQPFPADYFEAPPR